MRSVMGRQLNTLCCPALTIWQIFRCQTGEKWQQFRQTSLMVPIFDQWAVARRIGCNAAPERNGNVDNSSHVALTLAASTLTQHRVL
jgi:hypothetical protein